ncbi:hypothetical protein ACH5RR_030954 [Cinchona calisaya]|uniref:RNA helicase n=1 Tax=Cinchona calisaya TaxID=153742 RepID=A0ABD2YDT0_9GENT
MATAEAAQPSSGPRYAPDDPTLPQPWKGLIDGSTGVLYYWNPETNITQYEKPTVVAPPPLPPGPPPTASIPTVDPIPGARTAQATDVENQQMHSQPQIQQQQQHHQAVQQHTLQMPPSVQQQGSQLGPSVQQQEQLTTQHLRPQMMHYFGQQMPSQGQVQVQAGSQVPQQPIHQMGQQTQMYQGASVGNHQAYQFPHQQTQYMPYPQNVPPQGHQNSQQQIHQIMHGQQFPHQPGHKMGFPPREDSDPQRGKQVGYSPPAHGQPIGSSSVQNLSARTNSIPAPHMSVQPAIQFSGSSVNLQQSPSLQPLQQGGMDLIQPQHGPRFQNQMGPSMMHAQHPKEPQFAPKDGYDGSPLSRAGNDFYFNSNKDGHGMLPQQPKLAAIPMARNTQETRRGDVHLSNAMPSLPGGLSGVTGPPMHDIYGHATGGSPFPNNSFMRPPPDIIGPSDANAIHLSPADIYRQTHEVTATGDNVPAPFMTFEATGFPPEILGEIHFAGFSSPTPIQAQTWPIALQRRDIVAIAKTGSGKTLGYLIPAFMHLRQLRNNPQHGPTVLVLAPTRELATQIQDEAIKFGRSSRFTCTCLYGGASKGPQLKELERGADIVVATPGRLNDILESKRIDFRQVSFLVLDEADRMLDMGFEPQIRKIVNEIPPRRQTLMYTATWPKEVRKIANDLLFNPVQVNIGSVDELSANKAITQYVEVVPHMEKQRRLEQILRSQEQGSKIIIFCSTKKLCDQLARSIGRNFGAAAIHGDKNQSERDWVLNQFRSGKTPILVATDVAARGLDIRDIRVVINYDFPTGIEDYVHRIGRTGRAGATGVSYTFFSEQDWKYAPDLVKVLEGANQHVPQEVKDMALRGASNFSKGRVGINRFDSADGDGGRWESGGHGGSRDIGFGGRGGMRDGGFGGRGGMRDGGFGGRGGMRDGGFGGRGGMRDGGFGGCGGLRDSSFGGRGGRDGGFAGGGRGGWDRNDRYNMDGRGRGRGRGQGRFDNGREIGDRRRGRKDSSSPERVRTWGYSRSRSRSSRSYSRSRSRSRSWSRGYSPRRSRSRSPRRSRSRSHSYVRQERRPRKSKFDQMDVNVPNEDVPPESGMSPMSPGRRGTGFSGAAPVVQLPYVSGTGTGAPVTGSDPSNLDTES